MRRARVSPRQVWLGLLLGLLTFLNAGFRPFLSTADVGGQSLSHPQGLALTETLAGPQISARAAVLYDVDADRLLFERDAHARLAPASLTKLATALAALSRLDMQQVVTAGDEIRVGDLGGVTVGLVPGDRATVEQLLYGILLTSGNDAALTLAAGTGGSVEQFVGWMNELAGQLGMRDTHFVNPHGLDAPEHYASAFDMLLLARAALRQPAIARAAAMPKASIGGWNYNNTNELLGQYPGVDGVKTGTTDEAGQCLIVSATRDGRRVLIVIMGSNDRYADARALLDFYYEHYAWLGMALPANAFTMLTPDGAGRARYLAPAGAAQAFLARWEYPWRRISLRIDGNEGRASFYYQAEYVAAEMPLRVAAP
jgi:D-alanyl-D-alanine carboxypeptidase